MKKQIHYYIYKDSDFMKEIYTQVFEELPDIGAIEYIGSKSKNNSVNYKIEGGKEKSINKNYENDDAEKNLNKNTRHEIGSDICFTQSYGEDTIRFYANIDDIKTIVNSGMYTNVIEKIVNSECEKYKDFVRIDGKMQLFDGYDSQADIFVTANDNVVWLKAKYLDTDINVLTYILDKVNILGYVIKEKTEQHPRIVKAIAIFT